MTDEVAPRAPGVFTSPAGAAAAAAATVVVVDDEPGNVLLLERLLARAGVGAVHGFTEPRAALDHCLKAPPDLLLLDLHMPEIDGFAVMDELDRQLRPPAMLPVLVLTADVSATVKQRALAGGAKDFLTKPFDATEVLLRVCNLLETRSLYRHLEAHNIELQATVAELEAQARRAEAERARAIRRIERALAPGALTMVFQPVVDLVGGAVVGAEALARFACAPQRPPDEWFAEAASVGRGDELEFAAVAAAVRQIDQLPPDTFLTVNVSPTVAMAGELLGVLAAGPASRVVLELTEHVRVESYDVLVAALDDLRSVGIRIAADDTGAGYAGFQHVLRLQPDILKLDTGLTRGIDTDPVRRSLAAALVSFAHEIGASIIAEGIETAGELAALQRLGIRWGQGYHLARPGPLPLPAVRFQDHAS